MSPDPVGDRHVHEQAPGGEEDEVAAEGHAVGERAGDQGRRQRRDRELEHEEGEKRDGGRVVGVGQLADAVQEEVVEPADDPVHAGTERQREAHGHPDERHDAQRGEALHHDRDHVLVAHEAAVEEGQAWRHDRDQCGAEQDERGVAGVDVAHAGFPPRWGPPRRRGRGPCEASPRKPGCAGRSGEQAPPPARRWLWVDPPAAAPRRVNPRRGQTTADWRTVSVRRPARREAARGERPARVVSPGSGAADRRRRAGSAAPPPSAARSPSSASSPGRSPCSAAPARASRLRTARPGTSRASRRRT